MENITIDTIFDRARQSKAKVHFWKNKDNISSYSYQELFDKALLVTGILQKKGIKKQDRVAIVFPTDPNFYYAFFGVIFTGAIVAALYPPVRLGRMSEWKERTANMLKSIGCKAVITDKRIYNLLGQPVRDASPELGCFTIEELLKNDTPGKISSMNPEEICTIQFSSGTTGNPKPVALTHNNIINNATTILETIPGDINEHSAVSWLPLYHDMGLVGCLFSTMIAKRDLTLIRPEQFIAKPQIWLEALTYQKASISVAPNFAFGLCTKRIKEKDFAHLDLSKWKVAMCGAEAVHPNTLQLFGDKFSKIGFDMKALSPVYGLAEATLAVTFSPLGNPPLYTTFDRSLLELEQKVVATKEGIVIASVGQALPGTEIEVRDSSGQLLEQNCVGRVWIKGPGIMKEYYQNAEATKEIKQKGWLDTGDQGFIYQNNLYLCGRYKDTIIIRGRNYSATEIEHSIESVSGVRQGCGAAFSDFLNDNDDSESLVLIVEYRKEEIDSLSDLEKQIIERVQVYCNVKVSEIILVSPGTLPRTSSGKIRRNAAKAEWKQNILHQPSKGGLKTVLKESVQGFWQHRQAQKERNG